MEYNKIISVTGMPGLFELMSARADGAVVRSLEDGTTKFASTRQHQFSHLESIEIYTNTENVNLRDILLEMKNSKETMPENNADAKTIKAYFEKVHPDMDFDRVFNSDMKKMIKWFRILEKNNVDYSVQEEAAAEETSSEEEK
ncbi:MAG TPA: DUF5606 domain-containing protein [Ginsengibacter sp.]|mgnify:CR=1 FL=1|nr:DUF5606 domain-containing protein [Ginsengibacter sp.]HRP16676.1 DUF5606 domain-containing protein [Ginsengibacter sp.]HRP43705.1 DUF5606 domain-containing protein [Ginsengibacter sp.]